jgi:hypothetical protein
VRKQSASVPTGRLAHVGERWSDSSCELALQGRLAARRRQEETCGWRRGGLKSHASKRDEGPSLDAQSGALAKVCRRRRECEARAIAA